MIEVIASPLLWFNVRVITIILYVLLVFKVLYSLEPVPQLLLDLLIVQVHVIQVLVEEIPVHLWRYYLLC